ncbi:MAG: NAD-binding protein, partial [Leptospiraceae bacterium]|nr:NAD-binding protein [Leptospiraceae bacterium]
YSQGVLTGEWLIIIALAVSFSFIISSPLNKFSESIYTKIKPSLTKLETEKIHINDREIDVGNAKVLIFGMGRIGMGVYRELQNRGIQEILGIEHDPSRVKKLNQEGFNVISGDGGDSDFWLKLKLDKFLKTIFLAMPSHSINIYAAKQAQKVGLNCRMAGIAKFPEEVVELNELGVISFNMYGEAGAGLAQKKNKKIEAGEK